MVFCNRCIGRGTILVKSRVTILILIDGFLQSEFGEYKKKMYGGVTILILIDGFLQSGLTKSERQELNSHNPYFNRWFSAI